jgi:hypothetical protein
MKYYSKYSLEDDVWGVGIQYLEYDVQRKQVLRQVNDYGSILLHSQLLPNGLQAHGNCPHAETSLQLELEYAEDQVLERVFQAKWALATQFSDHRLTAAHPSTLTPGDVQELKSAFSNLV